MKMIDISGNKFDIEIKRKRIKTINLRVEGSILKITCPYYVNKSEIYKFIDSKRKWIIKQINIKSNTTIDDNIYYFGNKYKLIVLNGNSFVSLDNDTLYISCKNADKDEAIKEFYKHANKVLMDNINNIKNDYISILREYGYYEDPIITVKHLKSLLGVCHKDSNKINISNVLIHYNLECLRAILWHELLHLIIPNHQKAYYEILLKYMPNYKSIIREIK